MQMKATDPNLMLTLWTWHRRKVKRPCLRAKNLIKWFDWISNCYEC